MQFPSPTALHDLGAFVLGNHSLHLNEQRFLRRLRGASMEEHDRDAVRLELVEQENLVRVPPCESIGTVNVDQIELTLRDSIAQAFQRRTHQRRAAESLVGED
jgi:hypothetical protein